MSKLAIVCCALVASLAIAVGGAGARAPGAAASLAGVKMFESPSGNIGCAIVSQSARCDIRNREWPTPRKPSSCHLDYGNGMIVGRTGRGTPACAGDTVLDPNDPALGYGRSITFKGFTCTSSATNGITCRRLSTGHGFTIAIQHYRVF